jgi:hypothetical protein
LTKHLYVDEEYVGEVVDVKTVESLNRHHIEYIPPGEAEFTANFTVYGDLKDWWQVFHLSDVQIFEEYVEEGGEGSPENFDKLNVLSVTLVRQGEADFGYGMILFEDGTVWTG